MCAASRRGKDLDVISCNHSHSAWRAPPIPMPSARDPVAKTLSKLNKATEEVVDAQVLENSAAAILYVFVMAFLSKHDDSAQTSPARRFIASRRDGLPCLPGLLCSVATAHQEQQCSRINGETRHAHAGSASCQLHYAISKTNQGGRQSTDRTPLTFWD